MTSRIFLEEINKIDAIPKATVIKTLVTIYVNSNTGIMLNAKIHSIG